MKEQPPEAVPEQYFTGPPIKNSEMIITSRSLKELNKKKNSKLSFLAKTSRTSTHHERVKGDEEKRCKCVEIFTCFNQPEGSRKLKVNSSPVIDTQMQCVLRSREFYARKRESVWWRRGVRA